VDASSKYHIFVFACDIKYRQPADTSELYLVTGDHEKSRGKSLPSNGDYSFETHF
jgi:hypothetical protein